MKANVLLMMEVVVAVLLEPASCTTIPLMLPMIPLLTILGAAESAPEVIDHDAGPGVDDVVLVDQDARVEARIRWRSG